MPSPVEGPSRHPHSLWRVDEWIRLQGGPYTGTWTRCVTRRAEPGGRVAGKTVEWGKACFRGHPVLCVVLSSPRGAGPLPPSPALFLCGHLWAPPAHEVDTDTNTKLPAGPAPAHVTPRLSPFLTIPDAPDLHTVLEAAEGPPCVASLPDGPRDASRGDARDIPQQTSQITGNPAAWTPPE